MANRHSGHNHSAIHAVTNLQTNGDAIHQDAPASSPLSEADSPETQDATNEEDKNESIDQLGQLTSSIV